MSARHGWLAVVLVGAAVWSTSLGNEFQYDDFHSIVDNLDIRRPAQGEPWAVVLSDLFTDPATFSVDADKGMYRPLLVTSFAVNHALGGYAVEGFHVVNITVHLTCAVLVWWLAGLLGGGPLVRLAAGLLFAVHPVCSEPVNYISSRSESLSAAFYLLGLCLFLRAERGPAWWRVGTWLAMAAGLCTKSTTITLPAALLLLDVTILLHGDWRRLPGRLLSRHAPGWVVAAGYLAVVSANGWLGRSLALEVRGPWSQALTQAKAIGYYLHLLVVPTRLSVEPQFQEQAGLAPVVVLAGLLGLTGVALAAWLLRRRLWPALFLLIWPVLYLLPTLVIPLNVLVNERRAYVPVAVLCVGGAWLLGPQLARTRGRLTVAALVLVLALLSWQRSTVWADDLSLWEDAVRKAPRMARAHLYLGNAHKDAAQQATDARTALREWRAASDSYGRSLAEGRNPDLILRALNNRGGVLLALAGASLRAGAAVDFSQAEAMFREAVERNPNFADALINLGSCLLYRSRQTDEPEERQRLTMEAIDYFRRGLEVRPNHFQAHGNLGVALEALGRLDEAEASYRQALFLTSADWTSLKNLSHLLYQRALDDVAAGRDRAAQLRLREARSLAVRALQVNPATPGAREVLQAVDERLATLGEG